MFIGECFYLSFNVNILKNSLSVNVEWEFEHLSVFWKKKRKTHFIKAFPARFFLQKLISTPSTKRIATLVGRSWYLTMAAHNQTIRKIYSILKSFYRAQSHQITVRQFFPNRRKHIYDLYETSFITEKLHYLVKTSAKARRAMTSGILFTFLILNVTIFYLLCR